MSLSTGTQLGPYEILTPIGAGGMGEVYKARDTRLNRMVAIKVSHERFSQRFEHEARSVAALNHPHICQLYDVGPNYLVMEFIEGSQLRGPLPIAKAVEYAGQILDALDAAHSKGITHRDLKPANILVTRQGIKLLDFGLAKSGGALKETDSTLTALTVEGQIAGTLQYMSPEQLQGKEADARSDLFAFGCVLYEMLTGKRAFEGQSAASVIAAILEREPAPLVEAPPLGRVVKRCLAKDPEQRFQTARDLKAALAWTLEQPGAPMVARPASRPDRRWWIAAAVAIAIMSALGRRDGRPTFTWRDGWFIAHDRVSQPQAESRLMRFPIPPPENTTYRGGQVSPDGRSVVLLGVEASGRKQLWVRRLDSLTAQPLAGATEGDPFWSPDSRFIAFLQDGKLKKIDVSGGAPQIICEAQLLVGGSWNPDGTIIFGNGNIIVQVPANGGEARNLTAFDVSRAETMQGFPSFLPDGRHFVYTIHSTKSENGGIYLGSLDAPNARIRLLPDVSNAVYAPASPSDVSSGYLLFPRGQALMAQRFATRDLQLKGEAFPVVEKVARSASNLSASFSASQDGVLFINPTTIYNGDRLTWFDRAGKPLGTIGDPGLHFKPQLSPDGSTVVIDQNDAEKFFPALWLLPVTRGAASHFMFTASQNPVWSPDGGRIAFVSYIASTNALYAKTVYGTGKEELLLESGGMPDRILCDWSKNGRFLLYQQPDPKTGYDLWLLPLSGNRKPVPFLRTEFNERCGVFSPDGKWVAYALDESGRSEIYVQAFSEESAGSGRQWQVSYSGGTWPTWRRDGKELFYLAADRKIMAVDVKTGSTFQSGTPQPLFTTGIYTPDASFEVTSDGQRFLIPTAVTEDNPAPPTVVLNWTKGVKP